MSREDDITAEFDITLPREARPELSPAAINRLDAAIEAYAANTVATVEIHNVKTGQRVCGHTWRYLERVSDAEARWWKFGNGACDCVRSQMWAELAGEYVCGESCGEGMFTVNLYSAHGRVLWSEHDASSALVFSAETWLDAKNVFQRYQDVSRRRDVAPHRLLAAERELAALANTRARLVSGALAVCGTRLRQAEISDRRAPTCNDRFCTDNENGEHSCTRCRVWADRERGNAVLALLCALFAPSARDSWRQ